MVLYSRSYNPRRSDNDKQEVAVSLKRLAWTLYYEKLVSELGSIFTKKNEGDRRLFSV